VIAEDSSLMATCLKAWVTELGHVVVGWVRTGEDLIDLVRRENPDIALVDIDLAHGSDGLAAAQVVQSVYDVPAVATSGRLSASEAEAAGLMGGPVQALKPKAPACHAGGAGRQ
jgi:CheY-like chemotaxis protein